ncbi:hypothetical protein HTSR_0720 [Halodesulfurarchaeum formicicum]|uniref:Uncharacterized protein n=1 Tax=Halodesulfurarchaeum formicicum TaxID=1873524 RepID=A0A1D8S3K1_9EURY|nr:hypothetical protein [Halodesulfurarchaeum formicicum]AOW79911.1 hypothetical protein HTSR_0720 [Halodesulfurarchaeum formicicum]APE95204.1 hypothetical protein HSR6_0746 [Halodesulfurarchaeum formicicum]
MTQEHITAVEQAGMVIIGALVVIAMPVIGLLVTLTGSMSPMISYATEDGTAYALSQSAVPEGAEILATPLVGPNVRAAMLAIALVVLGVVAVYRLVAVSGRKQTPTAAPSGD